jgi:hypothetical protein
MSKQLKAVASMSGPNGDVIFVEDGRGDYPVLLPYSEQQPICLIDWSRQCAHVAVAKREHARCTSN